MKVIGAWARHRIDLINAPVHDGGLSDRSSRRPSWTPIIVVTATGNKHRLLSSNIKAMKGPRDPGKTATFDNEIDMAGAERPGRPKRRTKTNQDSPCLVVTVGETA